jgi:hypothetical protein
MRPLLRVMVGQKPKSTAATGSSGSGAFKNLHQWSNIKRTDHLEVSSFSQLQEEDEAKEAEWKTTGGSHIQPSVYDIELGRVHTTLQTRVEVDSHV